MTDIGATLREARMRERIDVSEIEAKTKIRARYLRALENEEWDLLPGPTFVRSFLRTYAQALGLDGKALVEEYRMRFEPPSEAEHQPVVSSSRHPRPRRAPATQMASRWSRGYTVASGVVGVIVVLLVIGLLMGKKGGTGAPSKTSAAQGRAANHSATHRAVGSSAPTGNAHPASVTLSLQPSAAVYVCLIGDRRRKLIPGLIVEPPYTPVTYRAKRFQITLGNNAVTMYVNGKPLSVPASSRAIGYSVTAAGRQPLAPGQLPTCT
ncbi:MAG: helix-turn-helix domain-containing protein [Solirubrobacteraceae bacterium]